MAEIFQNREQIGRHVGISIAGHCNQFSCIAGTFGHPIVGVQHRIVWQGLVQSWRMGWPVGSSLNMDWVRGRIVLTQILVLEAICSELLTKGQRK